MSISSHDQFITRLGKAAEGHECPYVERVLRFDQARHLGAAICTLSAFARDLEQLHLDGTCPPTHVDASPTTPWSDLIRATKL
jgi:hypothetical protein